MQFTSHNLTHQLVHKLGKAIISGKYDLNQSLPSEADICAEYDISRTATREAVKMLSAKGLIISRPRKGITIQHKEHWNLFDTDVLSWILNSTPSLQTLKDFLQLRMAIEPEAAALAAKSANKVDIEAINYALTALKQAEDGLGDPLEADIQFHSAILLASRNPFFVQLRNFIETALRVSIRFTNNIKGVDVASVSEHAKIYKAIVNGNSDRAFKLSRVLLAEALMLIESQMKSK